MQPKTRTLHHMKQGTITHSNPSPLGRAPNPSIAYSLSCRTRNETWQCALYIIITSTSQPLTHQHRAMCRNKWHAVDYTWEMTATSYPLTHQHIYMWNITVYCTWRISIIYAIRGVHSLTITGLTIFTEDDPMTSTTVEAVITVPPNTAATLPNIFSFWSLITSSSAAPADATAVAAPSPTCCNRDIDYQW